MLSLRVIRSIRGQVYSTDVILLCHSFNSRAGIFYWCYPFVSFVQFAGRFLLLMLPLRVIRSIRGQVYSIDVTPSCHSFNSRADIFYWCYPFVSFVQFAGRYLLLMLPFRVIRLIRGQVSSIDVTHSCHSFNSRAGIFYWCYPLVSFVQFAGKYLLLILPFRVIRSIRGQVSSTDVTLSCHSFNSRAGIFYWCYPFVSFVQFAGRYTYPLIFNFWFTKFAMTDLCIITNNASWQQQ